MCCANPGESFGEQQIPVLDCNDIDDTVYPDAAEICDGQANSCGDPLPVNEVDNDADTFVECTVDAGGWDGTGSVA